MKPLTEEIIKDTLGAFKSVEVKREGKGWSLVLPWGRKVSITDEGVDYTGIRQLHSGEVEEDREQLQFELMSFDVEVWGCIDVRKLPFAERNALSAYARAYELPVDDNAFRPFGIVDAIAVFGETATVRNNWFPTGWRITVPGVGFVVIGSSGDELNVIRIEGNLYEETLRFMQKMQGHAVVRGKTQFCATWVAHGEALGGIRVIPEIPRGYLFIYLVSHVVLIPIAGIGFFVKSMFPALNGWYVIVGGWLLISIIVNFLRGDDRKRGDALLNKFPQMSSRNARLDDARARGMLL